MRTVLLLICSIIVTNMFAQDQSESGYRRIQVGINFSPDYCFRTLKNNDGGSSGASVSSYRNGGELPKVGYTAGLNAVYNFSNMTGIELGVQLSNKGYRTEMMDLTFGSMIDPRQGFVYSSNGKTPTRAKFIYNDYYIDIPVKANFTFGKRKIRFAASAGVATNIFIKETSTSVAYYDDGSKEKHTSQTSFDYNSINISPLVSAGIHWRLSSRSTLKIEPTFRYGVLKIINDPVTGYLWSAGLNIGYYFGL